MSARLQTGLWLAQRMSAAILAMAVIVHLGMIIMAVQGGLSAGEIVGRISGNGLWLAFYVTFVAAVTVHAPIGLRTVLREMTGLPRPFIDLAVVAVASGIAWLGMRAVFGLYGLGGA